MLRTEIRNLLGMTLSNTPEGKCIQFGTTIIFDDVLRLITILRRNKAKIAIYDSAYPSPSDLGAYMDYSLEKAVGDTWNMTLGNHGWSGGIYRIDDETIAMQVNDLSNLGVLPQLDIENGKLFTHYDLVTENQNLEMISRIRDLHPKKA
jgi:hypothetical protein